MKKTFKKNEIKEVAKEIIEKLSPSTSATIVALTGDLGAGKTTLTQTIARELGIKENVISPTFFIMKSYQLKDSAYDRLVHIDAYRLDSHQELEKLGWAELIADPKNLILIEWPERVAEIIPRSAYRISLEHINEDERGIESF